MALSPGPSAAVGAALLALFPMGHLLYVPVGGAVATATDVAVFVFLLVWMLEILAFPEVAVAWRRLFSGDAVPGLPPRGFVFGTLLLTAFGAWVAASGVWGFHPGYALAKGLGVAALALTALGLATVRLRWERAVDAWLAGTGFVLAFTAVVLLFGPHALRERMIYTQGGVAGLPLPRVRGPFLHPSMLGDYLVLSGVLLWLRGGVRRFVTLILGVGIALFLLLSASTAWIAAGVVMMYLGRSGAAGGGAGGGAGGSRDAARGWLLRLSGAALAGAALAGVLLPVDVKVGGMHLVTSGVRPAIWRGALDAVANAPLLGVGAAPFLAEVPDPLQGGAPALWDAHNAYLSVLGQFGLVGALLLGTGLIWTARGAFQGLSGGRGAPLRRGLAAALLALGTDALFMASEDLRHLWLFLGVMGVMGAAGVGVGRGDGGAGRRGAGRRRGGRRRGGRRGGGTEPEAETE